MARTNEDAVVLASVRLDDDRLLILRQLPDRGTVEIGWWQRDDAGSPQQTQVLELAAEAVEVEAVPSPTARGWRHRAAATR